MMDGISALPLPSGMSSQRAAQLRALIRAVDIADLSHPLEERQHKASFLGHLNSAVDATQYDFFIHCLAENRGSLSNLVHQAIVETLHEQGAQPLLFYPDGVAYLLPRTQTITVSSLVLRTMARRCARQINEMIGQEYASFIKATIHGIKVDPKCLELGISFSSILNTINVIVQRKVQQATSLSQANLLPKVVERATRALNGAEGVSADLARTWLTNPDTLIPPQTNRLGDAELIRSYYIFLQSHFKDQIADAWAHIYDLFEVDDEIRAALAHFEPRYDRAYVLIQHINQGYASIYTAIEADGTHLLEQIEQDDEKVDLFESYLGRYALFGRIGQAHPPHAAPFSDHLHHYVTTQHKQCAHCSTIFPTDKWMTNDVRSDITVQVFSNRLRGGPGEPKKHICNLCQLQFLIDRLNYEQVRNEKTMYLHLFPYSFLPAPFITAMRVGIDEVRRQDDALRVLFLDNREPLLRRETGIDATFVSRTQKNKPHSYGLYLPRTRNTIGNQLIFPLNPAPADGNDSERFLFALWYAIIIQQHFGLKVLVSDSPVAPLTPEADLYLDNIALSCCGLLPRNDYWLDPLAENGGTLAVLQHQAQWLHNIVRQVSTMGKLNEMLALVRAMANGALGVLYSAEKLIEARVRSDSGNPEWLAIRLSQRIFNDLIKLAQSIEGDNMQQLSDHFTNLAQIAWQGGLRGKSLKKNSLMMPLDEVFKKLSARSAAFDDAALQAVIIEDIFEYLDRIADDQYRPGRKKLTSATEFVETFFNKVYHGVYQGNRTRLLADEKMLRSAFLFYIRQQIPSKSQSDSFEEETE